MTSQHETDELETNWRESLLQVKKNQINFF